MKPTPLLDLFRQFPGGCPGLATALRCSRSHIYRLGNGEQKIAPYAELRKVLQAFRRRRVVTNPPLDWERICAVFLETQKQAKAAGRGRWK